MRLLLGLIVLLAATASHAELAVVAGRSSPIEKLDEREVANIFLAKTTHLPNGNRVKPIELSDSGYKAVFYREISGKTLPQINSYWTTLIFTGKGRPPKSIEETSRLIEVLNNDPNTISYLPLGQITESVKVLHIFRD